MPLIDEDKSLEAYLREKGEAAAPVAKSEPAPEKPMLPELMQRQTEIKSTKDYDMFETIVSNREVDKNHVKNLVEAIKHRNLLYLNPIVVNKKRQVIDGQHRLEAARQLGVDVFYIEDSQIQLFDIAGMNSIKKTWRIIDFVNFHTSNKVAGFVEFSMFCNKNPEYSMPALLSLCGNSGRKDYVALKEGKIDISNIERAQVAIDQLNTLTVISDKILKSTRFIEAFATISNHPQYDHDRFVKKIAIHSSLLVQCINVKEYIKMFQTIYNRSVREENVVLFFKQR